MYQLIHPIGNKTKLDQEPVQASGKPSLSDSVMALVMQCLHLLQLQRQTIKYIQAINSQDCYPTTKLKAEIFQNKTRKLICKLNNQR